ncbi:MAG: hypothetical protein HWD58_18850 [Bacteroidota bacterium]|nr:MAG: hypothetical protein HWD58_18850 [Bacteroidota bacterium]
MALSDFFRINMPYGIKRNSNDEWFAFNREYVPLGWNTTENHESIYKENAYGHLPVYTKYKGLTEKKILGIIKDSTAIQREEDGTISRVFFYNDATNPKNSPENWKDYFELIKKFSELER